MYNVSIYLVAVGAVRDIDENIVRTPTEVTVSCQLSPQLAYTVKSWRHTSARQADAPLITICTTLRRRSAASRWTSDAGGWAAEGVRHSQMMLNVRSASVNIILSAVGL